MTKNLDKKGRFGLSTENIYSLRRDIRQAAAQHGDEAVLSKIGRECLESACASLTIDMTRREYGDIANAVKSLAEPKVKTNKYAGMGGPKAARD